MGGENVVHDLSGARELVPCGPVDCSIGPRAQGVSLVDGDVLEVEGMHGVRLGPALPQRWCASRHDGLEL